MRLAECFHSNYIALHRRDKSAFESHHRVAEELWGSTLDLLERCAGARPGGLPPKKHWCCSRLGCGWLDPGVLRVQEEPRETNRFSARLVLLGSDGGRYRCAGMAPPSRSRRP